MIALDDVVLRDDLDPRLGQRDDDLSDKMWAANLKHGVQYTRVQRQTQGLKLNERGLKVKDIAERIGVGASSVYRWTKEHRDKKKQERDAEIVRLRDEGMTTREIADEVGVDHTTVAAVLGNSQIGEIQQEPETVAEPAIEAADEETVEEAESEADRSDERLGGEQEAQPEPESVPSSAEIGQDEARADALPDIPEKAATPESGTEPPSPEPIPDHIFRTARAVMGVFTETRPDDYVARLEASGSEQMTITDDSLSNELERELLTSAAAMCLWQEWMLWYQGERTSTFTTAFGKIGPVFVRGRADQWTIVSRLRSMLRRLGM
ncbi:MAG: hypothetical protein J4G18_06735 [Anaerolineae bacterium]|nr:hypothetical protein [Anaerolineae bacterium]